MEASPSSAGPDGPSPSPSTAAASSAGGGSMGASDDDGPGRGTRGDGAPREPPREPPETEACAGQVRDDLRRASSARLFAAAPSEVPAVGGCVELREAHSRHLLPPEVVLFEPSQREIFFEGHMTGGHRQIFLNTPLTEEEQQALARLHQAIGKEADRHGYATGRLPDYVKKRETLSLTLSLSL